MDISAQPQDKLSLATGCSAAQSQNEATPELPVLSKNAARKLARYERVVAARRAKRREKKLARKSRLAVAKQIGESCVQSISGMYQKPNRRLQEESANHNTSASSENVAPCVCIDMGHTDSMSDKVEMRSESHVKLFPKESLLYLSPDAPDALPTTPLSADTVYIIGGLVDETVHKNISLSSARAEGIQCKQLPIDELMERSGGTGCKILTVNQVFDILLGVHETQGDWADSMAKVIPKRTGLRRKQILSS
ncbi:tRNA methyltransferase 10 homolog B-like isoform X2 [Haemaphysalis longicornis]